MNRNLTHRACGFTSLLASLLWFSALHAVEPPAGTLTALDNIGQFDGSTGMLQSCVALQDTGGEAPLFNVTLSLISPDLMFQVLSATPFDTTQGDDCSGTFHNGTYRDSILITNTDPALNGSVLNITMDHVPGPQLQLRLNSGFSHLSTVTFQFADSTSQSDRQLIEETVLFASDFMKNTVGRTLQQSITVITSTTVPGCANGGGSAFTGPRTITICTGNMGWTVHGPVNRQKILVHEFFHLLQFEQRWIGGPSSPGPHWLVEGSAEYLGWLGIAAMGSVSVETAHGCMVKEVADFALQQPPGLPNLSALETGQSFQRPGPVYPLAMLGAQQLVAGAGVSALLNYGSAIASGAATAPGFESAFGTSLTAFYEQFPNYRSSLPVPGTYACRL